MQHDTSTRTIEDVHRYWNENPLFTHELPDVGSSAYFDALDEIKRSDVERFSTSFWQFDAFRERRVLDVGCGPGWISVQYALRGAHVDSVDLTERAVDLTNAHLAHRGLSATVRVGNAEDLPFDDATFDLVVSSGVLHHTPNTPQAFSECLRVLKPGGRAKITLYRKGALHHPALFWLTRAVMRLLSVRHPGADLSKEATNVDDFIRRYDGADNPIGIAYTDRQWRDMLIKAGFTYERHEVHFFPRRFVPTPRLIPEAMHRALDRRLGTMVYFDLLRPVAHR